MSRHRTVVSILLFLILLAAGADARIWEIRPDGTGDAPTILAAVDSASYDDDIIELVDGVYTGDGNRDLYTMGKMLLIRSQSGDPTACIIDLEGAESEPHFGISYAEDG